MVGPRIIDKERRVEHSTAGGGKRMMISSGTTFKSSTWQEIGPYKAWMEIDYIDHEWCSRARRNGIELLVLKETS